jgi:serine/threonine protein kinase
MVETQGPRRAENEDHGADDLREGIAQSEWVDRVCRRFEALWRSSDGSQATRPSLKRFLDSPLAEARRELFRNLLLVDLEHRLRLGDSPGRGQYNREFPEESDGIAEVFRQLGLDEGERPPPLNPLDSLREGQEIDDCRLIKEIGRGSFARVFLGFQTRLGRQVAVKVSRRPSNEAMLLARLDHPHIVKVHHYRDLPDSELHVLTMHYVPSCDLATIIAAVAARGAVKKSGRLYLGEIQDRLSSRGELYAGDQAASGLFQTMDWPHVVCWIGMRLADALSYAHGMGVRHRDVKPDNILLDGRGRPLLVDFNISFGTHVEGASPRDCFGGSLPYMAPEHLLAFETAEGVERVGERSDVYSLAVVLCELLTGVRPHPAGNFEEPTLSAIADRIRRTSHRNLQLDLPGDCPRELKWILERCLEADPGDRLDAAEMARRLSYCSTPELRRSTTPQYSPWMMKRPRITVAIYLLVCVAACVAPNLLLIWLGAQYGRRVLMSTPPEAYPWDRSFVFYEEYFFIVAGVVFALAVALPYTWPALRAMPTLERGLLESSESERVAVRSLRIGPVAAVTAFSWWLILGIGMPVMNNVLGEGELTPIHIVQFFLVESWIGLMALPLTFLVVTLLTLHFLMLRLIPRGRVTNARRMLPVLRALAGFSRTMLAIAVFGLLLTFLLIHRTGDAPPSGVLLYNTNVFLIEVVLVAFVNFAAVSFVEPLVKARIATAEAALVSVSELVRDEGRH